MEAANFVIQSGLVIVLVLVGATIFNLPSVMCGYRIFMAKNHYIKSVLLSLLVGTVAFFFSDIPKELLDICCKHGSLTSPAVMRDMVKYLQDLRHYDRIFFISMSLAFLISGFIGTEFIQRIWKYKVKGTHLRVPITCWDALVFYYGTTGDKVRIYTKGDGDYVTGTLDLRSIGDEPEEIIVKNPKDAYDTSLGEYMLIRGDEISKLALEEFKEYKISQVFRHLFTSDIIHVITFLIGLLSLITFVLQPNYWIFWPFKTVPWNLSVIAIVIVINILL